MQNKDEKTFYLRKAIGKTLREMRLECKNLSCNKIENEYDLGRGNLSRIENAKFGSKFITIYRIIEVYGITFSDFAKKLQENLGDEFKLMDE